MLCRPRINRRHAGSEPCHLVQSAHSGAAVPLRPGFTSLPVLGAEASLVPQNLTKQQVSEQIQVPNNGSAQTSVRWICPQVARYDTCDCVASLGHAAGWFPEDFLLMVC